MKSIIRMFKAIPISSKEKKNPSEYILSETLKRGFIFSPEVFSNYSEKQLLELITIIEKEVGLTGKQMNSSFHKSWGKVKDSSMFQLLIEQLFHYITTYGYESLGIYDKDSVYIPNEKLEVPELDGDITLTVIKGYTKEEIKEKLLSFLNQGIALADETIKDVVDIALFINIQESEIEKIRNKETKIILYDYLGKIPFNPVEFLRYVVYKSTNKSLLIKNKSTIEEIKSKQNIDVLRYFIQYKNTYSLKYLAKIFFRFKPLFLAFRTNSGMKPIINRIRKLADVYHEPMEEDFLNSITAKLAANKTIDEYKLTEELNRVNTFRKVRLLYALNYRIKNPTAILYKIRNGKGYAKEFSFHNQKGAKEIFDIVLDSITDDISKNVFKKKIYIPENIVYALPATEKQFTGDFPSGTYITIPKDMIAGVYWENVDHHRIDLDLSLMSPETGKIGWDSRYRTESRDILFSGDMTDAQHGASELFYIAKQVNEPLIMFVNYFNYEKDVEVPFKILVAQKALAKLDQNYMVDPNNIICVAKSKISQSQKILGLVSPSVDGCRFYFSETSIGGSITSYDNVYSKNSRKYLIDFYTNTISLNEVLALAGAEIVKEKQDIDIDLSPQTLEKDKIITLLKKS